MSTRAGPWDIISNPAKEAAEYLRDKAYDALHYLVETAESFLINPPRPSMTGGWVEYLFGNFWGLAQQISILVAVVFGLIIMMVRTRGKQALQALGIAGLVAVGGGIFYFLAFYATQVGDRLAQAALFHQSSNSFSLEEGPVYDNAPLAFVLLGFAAFLAFILVLETIVFVYIGLFVQVLGVLLLGILLAGRFGQTMWRWALSIGLVAVVFGRALSVFSLEFGQLGIDHMPQGNSSALLAVLIMMAALGAAIILPILMILASNLVITKIQGGQNKATVEGDVDTREQNKEQQKVEVQAADALHRRSMLAVEPTPTRVQSAAAKAPTLPPKPAAVLADGAARAAVTRGVAAAAGPAAPAVVAAASVAQAAQTTRAANKE